MDRRLRNLLPCSCIFMGPIGFSHDLCYLNDMARATLPLSYICQFLLNKHNKKEFHFVHSHVDKSTPTFRVPHIGQFPVPTMLTLPWNYTKIFDPPVTWVNLQKIPLRIRSVCRRPTPLLASGLEMYIGEIFGIVNDPRLPMPYISWPQVCTTVSFLQKF